MKRRWLLILPAAAVGGTLAAGLFDTATAAAIPTDTPPPAWLDTLSDATLWPSMLGLLLTIARLLVLPWQCRTRRGVILAILLPLPCLLAPLAYIQGAQRLYLAHRAPGRHFESLVRHIAQSCLVYAADHDGHLPPHLAALVLDGQLRPRDLAYGDTPPATLPATLPAASAWPAIAPSIDAHCFVTYIGADLTDDAPSDIIMLYSHPNTVIADGRLFAFADSHVEYIHNFQFAKFFADSNAARAKLHLPPIPPPAP